MVGYLLSPLSWWNDAFVNLPLAVGFGWVVSLFYKPAFAASVVVGYWLTNVAGFILMHTGTRRLLTENQKPYAGRDLLRDVGISLLYTALIVVLLWCGILKPLEGYFPKR